VLALPGCFKSELPPGSSISLPDNGEPTNPAKDISDPATDVAPLHDGGHADDAAPTKIADATDDADISERAVVLDAGDDSSPEPVQDALPSVDEVSTTEMDTSLMPDTLDVAGGESDVDASGDCPTCEGAPFPSWTLLDFQPASDKFGESYGLEAFKGRVVVLALLAGW